MTDYDSIQKKLKDLKERVEELVKEKKENYLKKISEPFNGLDKDLKDFVKKFPKEDDWPNAPNQDEIIKKIEKDFPSRIETLNYSMKQITEELAVARKRAFWVIVFGTVILIILAWFYVSLHACSKAPKNDIQITGEFFNKIGNVKGVLMKPDVTLTDVHDAIAALPSASPDKENLFVSQFQERIDLIKGFTKSFEKNEARDPGAQDNPDKQLSSAATDQRIAFLKEKIDKIEKDAGNLIANDRFFWAWGFWKWLEILFWGEFGVIAGILVWVSTQTESGKYTMISYNREKYWYITEIIVGPFLVIAVFFLLKQFIATIMTGLTEEEVRGSVYMTLGISFVLGLFIRRTLGIFDKIKDSLRLPLPKT